MKEVQNREEDFIKKMMDKSILEQPSTGFTLRIMQELAKENQLVAINKPLISKQIWILIIASFLFLISFPFYFMGLKIQESYSSVLLQKISNNSIWQLFSNLKFSKTLTYALLVFAFFSLLQVFFIKSYFDKRFDS